MNNLGFGKKSLKIILAASFAVAASACTASKDSKGGANPNSKTDPSVDRSRPAGPTPNPTNPTAPTAPTEEDKKADNSGNEIKFDGPMKDEEKAALLDWASRYTGAADDELRSYLTTKFEDESNLENYAKALRFSNSIITAKLKVGSDQKSFKVVLKIKDPRKQETVKKDDKTPTKTEEAKTAAANIPEKYLSFSGKIGDSVPVSEKSKKVSSNQKIYLRAFAKDGKEFKNQSGTLECVDATVTKMLDCQTKVASINLNGALARIIFRTSDMNLNVNFKEKCLTETCDKLYEMFQNTQYTTSSNNRIKSRSLESFEVIQGRSAFTLLVLSFENEILKVEGELSNPEHSRFSANGMDELMNQNLTSEELKDPQTQALRKTTFNKFIKSVRMVGNEGNGNLNFVARSVIDKDSADLNLIEISLSRILQPIRAMQ